MAFDETLSMNLTISLQESLFLISFKAREKFQKDLIGIGNVLTFIFVLLLLPYADFLVQAILTAGFIQSRNEIIKEATCPKSIRAQLFYQALRQTQDMQSSLQL